MARLSLLPLLRAAQEHGFLVASFNVFNLETAMAVVGAAEQVQAPVVVAVAESHLRYSDFEILARTLTTLADRSTVPIAIHLDHAQTLDIVARAIQYGFTSVMFDGYGLSHADKVLKTRSVVDIAHSIGVSVEAELGHITKVGADADQRDNLLADPALAAAFVSETGVDVVAAALGTVHGLLPGQAHLDFERLQVIRATVPCYLSLHGGTGVKPEELAEATRRGISKVSYFTGLSHAAVDRLRQQVGEDDAPRLTTLMMGMRESMQQKVVEQITLFGSAFKASLLTPP